MNALPESIATAFSDIALDDAPSGIAASLTLEPRSNEDLVRIVRTAAENGVSLAPVGSGSTIGGAGTDIAVVTGGLAGVVDYQPDDLTIVVGAGTTLGELEDVLAERELSAILPESSPRRTIGGVVASGASGYRRLGYGPTRDRVLEVTMVTGYGEVVRAGGRLVKNVTGYDLSRLATGSLGSLGVITSVCFKLWPVTHQTQTVIVDDAASALLETYRPIAVLETDDGSRVYLQGDPATIEDQVSHLQGDAIDGFVWPNPPESPVRISVNVPPRSVVDAVAKVTDIESDWFVAQHGVGVIDIGVGAFDEEMVGHLRRWSENRGGSVLVSAPDLTPSQRWGTPPSTIEIQRRMKNLFDPSGVCNPGVLPGGL
ncbi:MAG: FAD-binding oxidoreductase [Actinomycetia bacterium]|nr:FAD-binding oxidoreductase [Actinomycetes bacterium]